MHMSHCIVYHISCCSVFVRVYSWEAKAFPPKIPRQKLNNLIYAIQCVARAMRHVQTCALEKQKNYFIIINQSIIFSTSWFSRKILGFFFLVWSRRETVLHWLQTLLLIMNVQYFFFFAKVTWFQDMRSAQTNMQDNWKH